MATNYINIPLLTIFKIIFDIHIRKIKVPTYVDLMISYVINFVGNDFIDKIYNKQSIQLINYNIDQSHLQAHKSSVLSTYGEPADNKKIAEVLNIDKIKLIHTNIIRLNNYFKKEYKLDDNKLYTFMGLRTAKNVIYNTRDEIYEAGAIMSITLTKQYTENIDSKAKIIILKQEKKYDAIYLKDPDNYVKNIIAKNNDDLLFSDLYYLEYYFKRLIQSSLTEFTLNYSVHKNNGIYNVTKQNKQYNYFILKNVKLIEKYILENLELYDGVEKEYFTDIQKHIKIISKGGNLIKIILDKFINNQTDVLFLDNYEDYFVDLSDWDFDIYIPYYMSTDHLNIIDKINSCDNNYAYIIQKIKRNIIKLIKQYFIDIENKYTGNDFKEIQEHLITQFEYINHLLNISNFFTIIAKHVDLAYSKNDNTNNLLIDKLDENLCNMKNDNIINILNKSYPVPTNSKNIFSYISQFFIGEGNTYFDLTRLCIRLKIPNCLMVSKVECIDFGFNIPYSINYNISFCDSLMEYKWNILGHSFVYYGKHVIYLTFEVLKLVFENEDKKIKRLLRFFNLLEYIYAKQSILLIKLTNINFKYLENIILSTTGKYYNINIIDACIYFFIKDIAYINSHITKLTNNSIYNKFRQIYDNLNNMNDNDKLIIQYPNNNQYKFTSWLNIGQYKEITGKTIL
jgi:hypothetical protein